jgi:hypothetical protein
MAKQIPTINIVVIKAMIEMILIRLFFVISPSVGFLTFSESFL